MEHESIHELIVRRATQEYPMSKSVFWVHLLSFLIRCVGGALFLSDTPIAFVLWILFSLAGVGCLWRVQVTESVYQKYLFYVLHYGITALADVTVLICYCFYPSYALIVVAAIFFKRAIRFSVRRLPRYKEWKDIASLNDLYYYRDIEKKMDAIAKEFTSVKAYGVCLIGQLVLILLGFAGMAWIHRTGPLVGWLCCTRCIQTLNTIDLPVICYWMRCIKKRAEE